MDQIGNMNVYFGIKELAQKIVKKYLDPKVKVLTLWQIDELATALEDLNELKKEVPSIFSSEELA